MTNNLMFFLDRKRFDRVCSGKCTSARAVGFIKVRPTPTTSSWSPYRLPKVHVNTPSARSVVSSQLLENNGLRSLTSYSRPYEDSSLWRVHRSTLGSRHAADHSNGRQDSRCTQARSSRSTQTESTRSKCAKRGPYMQGIRCGDS